MRLKGEQLLLRHDDHYAVDIGILGEELHAHDSIAYRRYLLDDYVAVGTPHAPQHIQQNDDMSFNEIGTLIDDEYSDLHIDSRIGCARIQM